MRTPNMPDVRDCDRLASSGRENTARAAANFWQETEARRNEPHNTTANVGRRTSPIQMRHSAATEIRKRFSLEGAQLVLGHATANITQVYAERDLPAAGRIAAEVG